MLPDPLIERCRELKRLGDHHTNSLNQLALMRFIESGEMERHIARMKKIYRKRRDSLIACLNAYFPSQVRVIGEAAGMHVIAEFSRVVFTPEILQNIEKAGVNVIPTEEHAMIKGKYKNQIILGYAHLCQTDIEEGLLRLKEVLNSA